MNTRSHPKTRNIAVKVINHYGGSAQGVRGMKREHRKMAISPIPESIIEAHGGWPAAFQGGEEGE